MSNEAVYTYLTQVTLEASGASGASSTYLAADDADLTSANHSNYPEADFVLTCDFGAGVAAGSSVLLYRRDLNIDGTNDSPAPSASCASQLVGAFIIPSAASASASYPCPDVPIAKDCEFYIYNGTDQDISAGWVLKATPKTFEPAT